MPANSRVLQFGLRYALCGGLWKRTPLSRPTAGARGGQALRTPLTRLDSSFPLAAASTIHPHSPTATPAKRRLRRRQHHRLMILRRRPSLTPKALHMLRIATAIRTDRPALAIKLRRNKIMATGADTQHAISSKLLLCNDQRQEPPIVGNCSHARARAIYILYI